MKTNPNPIIINSKIPKNHEGFKDSLGKPLAPGDEIIVHSYEHLNHAVITRFTPKRIYWKILHADDSVHDFWFNYENYTQVHYWYSTADEPHRKPEDRRRLRRVYKLEDPEAQEKQEIY